MCNTISELPFHLLALVICDVLWLFSGIPARVKNTKNKDTCHLSSPNGSNSNLAEATGRALASSFSAQSANAPSFHHSGLHNMHGNFVPNILNSLTSWNTTMTTGPSTSLQQPVNISTGRFSSSNLPIALSQISHGYSGIPDRGSLNVVGNPNFGSGIHGVGGSIPGITSSSTSVGNRNSVPGMSVNPILGNLGPRISSAAGNISAGGSSGRNINSGGLTISSLGSRANLGVNSASGAINVQGSNRLMGSMLQPAPQMMGMLRNSYTVSGGPISQGQLQGANNLLNSTGMLSDVNSNDGSPFDISDFPQLTGRPNSAGGAHNQLGSLRKQGLGVSSIVQQNQEFSIQNEDFPALPGYKGGNSEFSMDLHQKEHLENVSLMQSQSFPMGRSGGFNLGGTYSFNRQQQQQQQGTSVGSVPFFTGNNQDLLQMYGTDLFQFPHGAYHSQNIGSPGIPMTSFSSHNLASGIGSYDQLFQQYQHPQDQSQIRMQQIPALNQSYRDHSMKSMQGAQTSDPFGFLGFLSVVRANDPNLFFLAMGTDINALGLDLLSPRGDLCMKFGSPWSEKPVKRESEYSIPACYYSKPSPPLKQLQFGKFHLGTLFYIFYSMPKDEAQLFAAIELHARGWFFHKEHRLWLMRIGEPLVKTQTYERGSYHYMDPYAWQAVRKDNFVLHYDAVENQPHLP